MSQAQELGIRVISLVRNTKNAKRVAVGGVDVIVAQGYVAGGHTGRVSTFTVVPAIEERQEFQSVSGWDIPPQNNDVKTLCPTLTWPRSDLGSD